MSYTLEELGKMEKTDEVIELIIIKCQGLLNSQLNKFYMYNDPDALSYAYEALYKAIITYDPNGKAKFITYATVCIYNKLGSYLRATKSKPEDLYLQSTYGDDGCELQDIIDNGERTEAIPEAVAYIQFCDRVIESLIPTIKNVRHRHIIVVWRELGYETSHTDIAKKVGLSQSYVTQTINNFRHTFKKKLEAMEHGK